MKIDSTTILCASIAKLLYNFSPHLPSFLRTHMWFIKFKNYFRMNIIRTQIASPRSCLLLFTAFFYQFIQVNLFSLRVKNMMMLEYCFTRFPAQARESEPKGSSIFLRMHKHMASTVTINMAKHFHLALLKWWRYNKFKSDMSNYTIEKYIRKTAWRPDFTICEW